MRRDKIQFMNVSVMIVCLFFSVLAGAEESLPDLCISTNDFVNSDVTLSKALPKEGDRVTIRAKVHNKGDLLCSDIGVQFCLENSRKEVTVIGEKTVETIAAGGVVEVTQEWNLPQNGFYKVLVVIDPADKIKEKDKSNNKAFFEVPVLAKDLHVYYWVCPKSNRYVTSLMPGKEGANYWAERGVIPTKSREGFIQWNWTEEQFANTWPPPEKEGWGGIAIDEFGDTGPLGDRMAAALIKTKERYPNLYIVVWAAGLGGASSIEAYRKAKVDLLIAETYCYGFPVYGKFDAYWKQAQKYGLTDRLVFAIAFGSDCTTEQELVRQVKYIKKLAPEMKGVGFFTEAPAHLYASADKAVLDYYVKPVIWVKNIGLTEAIITNIGGMDAGEVDIEFLSGKQEEGGKNLGVTKLNRLKAGSEVSLKIPSGTKNVLIVPKEHYTVLE